MKELAELKDIMAELLDGEIQYEPEMAVTERGKEIINEIADYAETTELFRKEHHRGDMLQGKTFREMFLYMLDCGIYGKSENGVWGQLAKMEKDAE